MGQGDERSPKMESQQYQPQPYQPMVYQQQQPYPVQQQPQQGYGYNQTYQQQQPQPQPQQPMMYQQVQPNDNMKQPLLSQQPGGNGIYVSPFAEPQGSKFPEKPPYRDLMFHILFYLNIVGVILLYIVSLSKDVLVYEYINSSESSDSYSTTYDTSADYSMTILGLCALSVCYSLAFIFVWMKLASKYPKQLITWTFIGNFILCGIILVLYIVFFNLVMVVIMAIVMVVNLLFFFMWRKRIEFTGTLLTNTTHLLSNFPGAYRVAYGSLVVSLTWFTLWGLAFQRSILVYEGYTFYGVSIYLVFSLYWVGNVIKNVVHTTVAGLFSSWYFLAGNQMGMPSNPTMGALKRSMTTSFGSIAFGSLLLAIISTLRYISNMLQNSKNGILVLIGCFFNCILAIMQSVLAFFNTYNFAMIAIYGESYCDSGKRTVELFTHRLGSLLVNDDFISVCLSFSALLGGAVGGIFGLIATKIIYDSLLGGVFVFFVCFIVILMALEIVYSGVVTLFVCFMMDPNILAQTKPEIYKLYISTYKIK
ncbi:hypothetical protein DLAC_03784 [Tieghemostelium lacteum]|uniref:Choline transporter-like protein n=1 Tax=Tieghemostelium lacteum TaxID=361077 RepID=A0A152A0V4_TIELA|nr:hypothetical protein DLAC_03784 [Tieghemostelium lacteum]|eukprot:KYQ99833.1 hypothetical protein DLAC_03784 [Tieghemostelium lacteum]